MTQFDWQLFSVFLTFVVFTLLLAYIYRSERNLQSLKKTLSPVKNVLSWEWFEYSLLGVIIGGLIVITGWSVWYNESIKNILLSLTSETGLRVVTTLTAFIFAFFLSRILQQTISKLAESEGNNFNEHNRQVLYRFVQVAVLTGVLSSILSIWRIDISGFLVGAGVLGIILGLAARKTLGSVLAGAVIMIATPYRVGDWIEFGDEYQGQVQEISFVNTRLSSPRGKSIIIPNDVISEKTVINFSEKGRYRIQIDFTIDYDADVEKTIRVVEDALSEMNEMDGRQPAVDMMEFGDSAIELQTRFWIQNPTPRRIRYVRTNASQIIKTTLEKNEINIPFPQQTLSFRDTSDETEFNNQQE